MLQAVFTAATGTIGVQVVGPAAAWTAPSDKSEAAIWADVFDAATGTIRIVEV